MTEEVIEEKEEKQPVVAVIDRLTELEQAVKARDAQIAELTTVKTDLEARLGQAEKGLGDAVGAYRVAVTRSNPDILTELIAGETVAAIDKSLEAAKGIVSKVRKGLEAVAKQGRVPAGAPVRGQVNGDLSARDKILRGMKEGK
jgi:hypothetical protein